MKEDEAQAVVATCAFISNLCLFVQLCGQLCKELWLRRALGSRQCLKQPQPRGENGQLKASAGQKFSRGG